jgi:hypothetical protein
MKEVGEGSAGPEALDWTGEQGDRRDRSTLKEVKKEKGKRKKK